MKALLLAAAVLAADQRFLIVTHEVMGDGLVSYSQVYQTQAEASLQAERIALCGFWRVNPDPSNPESSLVAPGAVRQVFLRSLEGAPPADALELPPPPTVEVILDCPAAGRTRKVSR